MSIAIDPSSRKFLVALHNLSGQLRQPPNKVQVAAAVDFDVYEADRSLEQLLHKDLVHYANDIYREWTDPYRDLEPLMITRLGRQVVDGTA